jgi:hypothetical protein
LHSLRKYYDPSSKAKDRVSTGMNRLNYLIASCFLFHFLNVTPNIIYIHDHHDHHVTLS